MRVALTLLAASLIIIGLSAAPVMPTRRCGLILVGVLVSALVLPTALVIGGVLVIAGATLADAVVSRAPPRVHRVCADRIVRASPSPLSITVGSEPGADLGGPSATRHRVRQPRGAEVVVEPPEGSDALDATLIASRRGRHTIGAPAIRSTGPMGLAAWYRTIGSPHDLVVYPDVLTARRIAAEVRRGRFGDAGERLRGPLGLGTDFESIRDYLPDDDIRQVNWSATQREGRPMSNQYRVEQDRTVIGVLDAGRLMAAPVGDRTRLDAALDAFVAIAYVADEVGDRAGAVAFTDRVLRAVNPRRRGADAIVRACFDIEPVLVDSAYDLAFRSVGGGKRSLVIVFTDLVDQAAAAELVAAIPVLARRHVVLVASIIDPEIEDLLVTDPTAPLDVYRAAAAIDVLAPRDLVVHQLRRAGAIVVEARPDQFTEACVRAYLRAKTRSRF